MIVFLYLGVLVGCTYVGYSYSKIYIKKVNFYSDFINYCNILKAQIKFKKNSIKDITSNVVASFQSDFKNYLTYYILNDDDSINVEYLTQQQQLYVINFLKNLGKLDVDGEVANINAILPEIDRELSLAHSSNAKHGNMGTKLGFLAGLLVCIVLL